MKRLSLRSICASRSMSGTPATWLRRPSSAYSGMNRIPARRSRSDAVTVAMSLPRHETMPMPVTTTRVCGVDAMSERFRRRKQAHAQVVGEVDLAPIDIGAAIGDHKRELAAHDTADVD